MDKHGLTAASRKKLTEVSTATLTTVLFKHGLRNTFIHGVGLVNPQAPRMVGEAYTLRTVPAREDLDTMAVLGDPEHPQRKAIESVPPGQVLVIDSRKDRKAASGGDILLARLYKRGVAGVVTDGGFRDTPTIATFPFPAYHAGPSAPLSQIHHHMVEANVAIGCGDVPVYPGDVIVGDGEGVVVIPAHLANYVAEEACAQTAYEDFVQEEVMKGRSIIGLYPATAESRREFETWQAKTGKTDG